MNKHDLGPMPEPTIEPGDPGPGGVDAVPVRPEVLPIVPDLPAALASMGRAATPQPGHRRQAARRSRAGSR